MAKYRIERAGQHGWYTAGYAVSASDLVKEIARQTAVWGAGNVRYQKQEGDGFFELPDPARMELELERLDSCVRSLRDGARTLAEKTQGTPELLGETLRVARRV